MARRVGEEGVPLAGTSCGKVTGYIFGDKN